MVQNKIKITAPNFRMVNDSFLMKINYSINPIFAPIGATGHLVERESANPPLPFLNSSSFLARLRRLSTKDLALRGDGGDPPDPVHQHHQYATECLAEGPGGQDPAGRAGARDGAGDLADALALLGSAKSLWSAAPPATCWIRFPASLIRQTNHAVEQLARTTAIGGRSA